MGRIAGTPFGLPSFWMITNRCIRFATLSTLLSSVNGSGIFDSGDWSKYGAHDFQNYTAQQCQVPYNALNASASVNGQSTNNEGDLISLYDPLWTVTVSQPYNEAVGVTNYSLYLGTHSNLGLDLSHTYVRSDPSCSVVICFCPDLTSVAEGSRCSNVPKTEPIYSSQISART